VVYKKQDHYNKWEFNYDPVEDQMKAAASLFGGSNPMGMANGPGTGAGNPGGLPGGTTQQNGSSFGNSGSDFGFGQSGVGGSSPSPSPSPMPTPPTSSPTNPQ
jgi:hypothetical protein